MPKSEKLSACGIEKNMYANRDWLSPSIVIRLEEHNTSRKELLTSPMSSFLATSSKSTAADDERTLGGCNAKKRFVGRVDQLITEKVVDVILLSTIGMGSIRRDSMDSEVSIDVVNGIWRVIDVSHPRSHS